jgi:hypothetical protein
MTQYPNITYRTRSFLSSIALGLSAVVITIIICCTVVVLYVARLADQKSDQILSVARGAVGGLPDLMNALPPIAADMLDDYRAPGYAEELAITATVLPEGPFDDRVQIAVEIANNGSGVVSLLSLRMVALDERDIPVCEAHEWAATPIALDDDWRGPLMPGSRRHFVCANGYRGRDGLGQPRAEVEITELRIWKGSAAEVEIPAGSAIEPSSETPNEPNMTPQD